VVVAASSAIPQQQLHRTNEEAGFAAWQEQQTFLNADLYMRNEVPILDGVEIDASLQQTSDLEIPIAKLMRHLLLQNIQTWRSWNQSYLKEERD
jgi:hypothetical protein